MFCQIHSLGLTEFTAQQLVNGEPVRIDVDDKIPSEPQLSVVISPAWQWENWVWKIEDCRISYHPSYQGQFGPRWDD